jgi:hypothetical protein
MAGTDGAEALVVPLIGDPDTTMFAVDRRWSAHTAARTAVSALNWRSHQLRRTQRLMNIKKGTAVAVLVTAQRGDDTDVTG